MAELDRNSNDNDCQMMLIAVLAIAAELRPASAVLLRLKSHRAGVKVRRMMDCHVAQMRIERHISTVQGDIK